MATLSKVYLGTNTKMYKTIQETQDYLSALVSLTADLDRSELELFVIPSYTTLYHARKVAPREQVKIGAQNMGWEERGQFTGEISPLMLKEVGCDIVMVGHSERRHVFGEGDTQENLKVLSALNHGLMALLCVGETAEQRDGGISDETLRMQIILGLQNVPDALVGQLWIAYEPVWAIGVNGTPASETYSNEKHGVIKQCLRERFGPAGETIPVLYGGSVSPENAVPLMAQPNIDGLFIGRSAWDAERFNRIIRSVLPGIQSQKERNIMLKEILIGCDNAAVRL